MSGAFEIQAGASPVGSAGRVEEVPSRKAGHRKHIPQRTCVGCRQVLPKRSLIRIVRSPDGIHVDPTGKAPGRGAYLHDQRSCWEAGLRGAVARALRTELAPEAREVLEAFMNGLADERHG